jgi:hypothetical protein
MQTHHTLQKIPFLQRIIAFAMKPPYLHHLVNTRNGNFSSMAPRLLLQKILLPYIHISNEFREAILETKYSFPIIFPLLNMPESRRPALVFLTDLVWAKYIPYSQLPDKWLHAQFILWFIDEIWYHSLIKVVQLSPLVILTKKLPGRSMTILESVLASVSLPLLKSFLSKSDKEITTFHFAYNEMLMKILGDQIEKHPDFPEMLDLIFSYIILALRKMAEKHFRCLKSAGKQLRPDQDENDLTKMKIQEKEDLFKMIENFLENHIWSPKVYAVILKNGEVLFSEEQMKKLKDFGVKRPDGFFAKETQQNQ